MFNVTASVTNVEFMVLVCTYAFESLMDLVLMLSCKKANNFTNNFFHFIFSLKDTVYLICGRPQLNSVECICKGIASTLVS